MNDNSAHLTHPKFSITIGAGRDRPQGKRLVVGDSPSVEDLAATLRSLPRRVEAWWSAGLFDGDYRSGDRWLGTWLHGGDIDYHDESGEHAEPPPEMREVFERIAASLAINLWHPTPRGYRTIVCFAALIDDPGLFERAARTIGERLEATLRDADIAAERRMVPNDKGGLVEKPCGGFVVDAAVLTDRARFLFSPRARVDGVDRVADMHVVSRELIRVESLVNQPPSHSPSESVSGPKQKTSKSIARAAAAYDRDHSRQWPSLAERARHVATKTALGGIPRTPIAGSASLPRMPRTRADAGAKGRTAGTETRWTSTRRRRG
jgi:hypothetical protein